MAGSVGRGYDDNGGDGKKRGSRRCSGVDFTTDESEGESGGEEWVVGDELVDEEYGILLLSFVVEEERGARAMRDG